MKKILYNIIAICVFAINSFAQSPTISTFSPTFGTIGTLVTITGTNLGNIDTLKIGGVAAIKVSATSTNLVAMVMPGAITGNIYIANNSGNVSSINNFTKTNSIAPSTQQGSKLLGTDAVGSSAQGRSVSISADGNTAIVGGYFDSSNIGAVWIYIRTGSTWTQQGNKLVGTGYLGNTVYQGRTVSLSADGNTAIVGGDGDSSFRGAAWIFTRTGNTWTQQGNKLVGTGYVGTPQQGSSVSISADGNTAIIGGYGDSSNRGAAWIFTRTGNTWIQHGNKLVGTGFVGTPQQGSSVSISANGNTAIVGGYGDSSGRGAAWIFTKIGNYWIQQGSKLVGSGYIGNIIYQGYSVCISADGNTAIVGGPGDSSNRGADWIFTRTGNTWIQQGNKLKGTGKCYLGRSVSLSADGNIALMGVGGSSGNSWIFTKTGTIWTQQEPPLIGSDYIGFSGISVVSLSADGKTAFIGFSNDNSNIGATWVFISPSFISTIDTMQVFKSCFGYPSQAQIFTVSGENLSSDSILIEAPTGFEISRTLDSGYSANLKLAPNLGIVNNVSIYVRIKETASGTLYGTIVCSSLNAVFQNIAVSGIVTNLEAFTSSNNNTICSAKGNGTATISSANGASPYTYLWGSNADNQTTQTAIGLKEDIYFVTVSDANKCAVTKSVNVLNSPNVNTQLPITNIAMLDQSSTINFSKYYNYDLPLSINPNPNNPKNYADAGKYFRFKIQSKNKKINGQSVVNGYCKVRSNSPYLNITDSIASLNNMAYNGKVWTADEFEVYINPATPKGSNLYLDFVVEENTTQFSTGCLSIPIAPLIYSPNTALTIDDDNNPDSYGNNNDTCELGETIEFYPWLNNVSDKNAQYVKGTLLNNNNFAGVNIWNNIKGVNDTVMNSTWWNYAFGKPTSIDKNSVNTKPAIDFVFDYSYGAPRNNFDLNLAVSAGFRLLADTTLSLVQWSLPYTFNSEVGTADTLQVNQQSLFYSSEASSKKLDITSNRSWAVGSNQSWVTLNKTVGNKNDSLIITIQSNTGNTRRSALVTITSGLITKTVSILQDSLIIDILNIDQDTIYSNAFLNQKILRVISNRSWIANSNQSWINLNKVNGFGNDNIDINISNNLGIFKRSAVVTVTAGLLVKTLIVIQDSSIKIDSFSINKNLINSPYLLNTNKVTINSNRTWLVTSNQSWVTLNKTAGLGNDSLNITIAANIGLSRTALLTFTAGLITKTLTINQDSFTTADILSLDKDSIYTSFGASLNTVQVSSNRSWTVSSNQSWCGVSTVTGSGNGSFNVINTINSTGLFRNALITVAAGSITKNVFIGQSSTVGINNPIIDNKQISLYPNPNNGKFTIQLKNTADKYGIISIVDMLGRTLYEKLYILNGNEDIISISDMHLQAGTYNIIIGNKDRVASRKSFVVVGD